jgi:hypothetical protein
VGFLAGCRIQLDFRDLWRIARKSETDSAGAGILSCRC